jgi:hypothetical protein
MLVVRGQNVMCSSIYVTNNNVIKNTNNSRVKPKPTCGWISTCRPYDPSTPVPRNKQWDISNSYLGTENKWVELDTMKREIIKNSATETLVLRAHEIRLG